MAALMTLMTRFCAGEEASWLAATTHQEILALQMPEIATASHDATDTSAATMATMPKTRQLMSDSVALNPVRGKSCSKDVIRARPVRTAYSIARVKFMAPPINQPTTPTENAGCSNRPAS